MQSKSGFMRNDPHKKRVRERKIPRPRTHVCVRHKENISVGVSQERTGDITPGNENQKDKRLQKKRKSLSFNMSRAMQSTKHKESLRENNDSYESLPFSFCLFISGSLSRHQVNKRNTSIGKCLS